MKKSFKQLALVSAMTSAVCLGVTAQAADSKPVLLKVPVIFGTHLPGLGSTVKWVGDNIGKVSNGSVKMKIYEPKKLVAPFEILDAVSTGKVNAGYSTAGFWSGKIPAAPLFTAVPFGPEAGEYMAWMYYGNGLSLYQEMYDQANFNVHVMPCGITAPETSGWFSKPINSPEDLKGLKMRFFGLGGQVMQKLGVSVAALPGGEIFPALEKKAIDATEFTMPAVDQRLGFHKVVKYNYFPGWHQQATIYELLVNKETWNGLSENQQAAINVTCKAAMTEGFAQGEAIQFEVMKENVASRGVKNMYWSDDMLSTFKKTWLEVVEENKKDAFFSKVWADMSQFRDGYDLWESHAFLPRKTAAEK